MNALLKHVEAMAEMKDIMVDAGTRLFNFERWLLDNGELSTSARPADRLGKPKFCYQNAYEAAMYDCPAGFAYTEGQFLRGDLPIAIDHAWLQNEAGEVIDVTIPDAERCQYLGVPFTRKELAATVSRTGYYGVLQEQGVRYNEHIVCQPLGDKRAWPQKEKVEA